MKRDTKMKLFKATVKFRGEMQEVPIWLSPSRPLLKWPIWSMAKTTFTGCVQR
ncbi:putative host RNA-polymerase inhibitor [Pseudomonas phage Pf1 ERZ-2017]|uniref:Putative host RNA-polymerase inhibitor n=1 Tax=Pseudomonas phage Pf1 ERZ-2017 TaxID=2761363 RepID=A0A2H4YGA3_9CAUD|nr:putative host RNA-polymerase inhibitor [Pseudomonas phage Pf1 ERZ-2017]AUE23191.1 putative host RNA-polymerase inhibitor [Pseudomonas phage Pf1 ERZ-2017]